MNSKDTLTKAIKTIDDAMTMAHAKVLVKKSDIQTKKIANGVAQKINNAKNIREVNKIVKEGGKQWDVAMESYRKEMRNAIYGGISRDVKNYLEDSYDSLSRNYDVINSAYYKKKSEFKK